ncbi:hypothetical protein BDP27DRAFT_1451114 [Rhodocollybia butyracea]|uniref:Uncharacterized protein n=1 Tax=Rhodocollybia butyracea TaxID=206335 RepID=A0A9P5U3I9_9AGAR|nr:hypothetical protein BDP27DRAFT_1451114 [Rhodocollybia butyracea]
MRWVLLLFTVIASSVLLVCSIPVLSKTPGSPEKPPPAAVVQEPEHPIQNKSPPPPPPANEKVGVDWVNYTISNTPAHLFPETPLSPGIDTKLPPKPKRPFSRPLTLQTKHPITINFLDPEAELKEEPEITFKGSYVPLDVPKGRQRVWLELTGLVPECWSEPCSGYIAMGKEFYYAEGKTTLDVLEFEKPYFAFSKGRKPWDGFEPFEGKPWGEFPSDTGILGAELDEWSKLTTEFRTQIKRRVVEVKEEKKVIP